MRRWFGLVLAAALMCGRAQAEGGAALLLFPKVVASSDRDTIIQIVNVGEGSAFARCFYAAAAEPAAGFRVTLASLQPTLWSVLAGRPVDAGDLPCAAGNLSCVGAGNDPGRVPPVVDGFAGALWCVQTDAAGAPLGGAGLAGQATVIERDSADVVRYPAIGFAATGANDGDDVLCLGGPERPGCPTGAEYEGCPDTWLLPHLAADTLEPLIRDGTVSVELSAALCTQDLAAPAGTTLLTFALTNEFEESFSAATTTSSWASFDLKEAGSVFRREVLGSDQALTHIRSAGPTPLGIALAAEAKRDNGDGTTRTSLQPGRDGTRASGDILRLGPETEAP